MVFRGKFAVVDGKSNVAFAGFPPTRESRFVDLISLNAIVIATRLAFQAAGERILNCERMRN